MAEVKDPRMGKLAKDKATGFSGAVLGKASYVTGCDQFLIQPKVKEGGDFIEGKWIDEGRLDFTDEVVITPEEVTGEAPGADIPAPIK